MIWGRDTKLVSDAHARTRTAKGARHHMYLDPTRTYGRSRYPYVVNGFLTPKLLLFWSRLFRGTKRVIKYVSCLSTGILEAMIYNPILV